MSTTTLSHPSRLSIGGIDATELAAQFGTPLYVYDAQTIIDRYHRIAGSFPGVDVHIHYACKALTNLNILRLLLNEGAGLDATSIEEAELGLRAGFSPDRILFTPNSDAFEEIRRGVELGVRINIDNISVLEQFGHAYGESVPVCIRINPHIMAGGNPNISTGHIDSKFGISVHQLRHVHRVVRSTGIRVEGLHMHTGSDILDPDVFLRGAEILYDAAVDFEHLAFIDFGSGFKVAYKPGDPFTDLDVLGPRIAERHRQFCQEYGRPLALVFEPGKFIVSEAGYLLVRANVIKQTTAAVFVGVDSGFNHLIRPMLYGSYHRIENVSNPGGTVRLYTVVGNLCETDTFAWDRSLAEVREGDILCFYNAGAYGFSMASNYNSRRRPAEVLVKDGRAHLIRRRENLDDLLATTVLVDGL